MAHVKGDVQRSVITSAVDLCVLCPINTVVPLYRYIQLLLQQHCNSNKMICPYFALFTQQGGQFGAFISRQTQSPAPSGAATRSPMLHLSGTPGAFPAGLQSHPRDAAAATASCHVATISNTAVAPGNATKPRSVARTDSFTRLTAQNHAEHFGFYLVAGVFRPRRRQR